MRVLIFSQHYWPESFYINDVALSLREAGCQVSVLTGQPNYPEGHIHPGYKALRWGPEQHPAGHTIYRVPLVPRGSGRAARLALNYISFLTAALLLAPWVLRGVLAKTGFHAADCARRTSWSSGRNVASGDTP